MENFEVKKYLLFSILYTTDHGVVRRIIVTFSLRLFKPRNSSNLTPLTIHKEIYVPHEDWRPIDGFPEYLVSDLGRVYNTRTESVMAESRTMQGDLKVTLSVNGERTTKSVRVLVAEAFVEKPYFEPGYHKSAIPDTVIVLDNDQNNVTSYNLAWRPRWFAHKYARQFKQEHPDTYFNIPVQNVTTGAVYLSVVDAAVKEGLLFNDIFKSAQTGLSVYPTNFTFIFP